MHLGRLRSGPVATGVELQRDNLLRAHIGRLALDDGTGFRVDQIFCIVKTDDDCFEVVTRRDRLFCIVKTEEAGFEIVRQSDQTFCVVLVDEDEVQL